MNVEVISWNEFLKAGLLLHWPPYGWWRDIGTSLISASSALIIGGSTLTLAVRAQSFARAAKTDADRQQYEGRLVDFVEKAVDEGLVYVKGSTQGWAVGRNDHRLAQAAVVGRMVLLSAVARGDDRKVVDEVIATFGIISDYRASDVQVQSISELIGALAGLAAREHSTREIIDAINTIRRSAKITDYNAAK